MYPIKREPTLSIRFASSNPYNYRSPPVFDLIFNQMPYVNRLKNYAEIQNSNYPYHHELSLGNISRYEKFEYIKTQRDAFFRSKIDFCSKMALYAQIEQEERSPLMGPSRNSLRYCYDNILFNFHDKIKDKNSNKVMCQK